MNDETQLIQPSELDNPIAVFKPEALNELLKKITDATLPIVHDASEASGRAAIKSLAYKIARSKTAIDDVGKDLVADLKKQSGEIDKLRKHARDTLDELKATVRKPLTEWEQEQERIEREAREKIEAERRAKEEADAAELAALRAEKEARDAADRAAEIERARLAREEEIRREGIERGKREALAQQQAPARSPAPRTQDAPAQPAPQDDDIEHRRAINREAIQSLADAVGVNHLFAVEIIKAIVNGRVTHVSINY